MIVSMVVAISENNAIGKNNQLLWHLPADLKHFKEITSGHTIIMGRKTYESIGEALPKRRNIVITRNTELALPGVEVMHSLQEALSSCEEENEVFIIGGAEIFNQSLNLTDKIYLTRVHQNYAADTFFPDIDLTKWQESNIESHEPDEKNAIAYTFSTLESK
ncbi:dihydrofolate reductase [Pedobacter immunditicola]|uniref:dihydrofolate reductase n=1 Tax=Pedobacter immunditicola TaxID=3133440 RepID=UPI0030A12635